MFQASQGMLQRLASEAWRGPVGNRAPPPHGFGGAFSATGWLQRLASEASADPKLCKPYQFFLSLFVLSFVGLPGLGLLGGENGLGGLAGAC